MLISTPVELELLALVEVPHSTVGETQISAQALEAQKDAVTVAIRRLFFVSLGIGAVLMLLAATIREIPIRSTFRPAAEEALGEMAGG